MSGPSLRTLYESASPILEVRWSPSDAPQRFCGDSWCTGQCGLPALVMPHIDGEWKAYSAMTACGPVMQPWRVQWLGEKVEIPEEHREHLRRRMWI
jgi:hypothetical protein